jgi:hypothetical protein
VCRKLSGSAVSEFLPLHSSRSVYRNWLKLIDELQQFIDILLLQFHNIVSGEIDYDGVHINHSDICEIQKKADSLQKAHGNVYRVVASSYIGEQLAIQCKSLDIYFIVIQILLNTYPQLNERIKDAQKRYSDIVQNFKRQCKDDDMMYTTARSKKIQKCDMYFNNNS